MTIARAGVGLILLLAAAAGAAESELPQLLPEGTLLKGVDGTVVCVDSNDLWRFELGADVNETDTRIAAGTRFELLPSAILEHLIVDVNDRQLPRYRLTAQMTQYRGMNFLLPSYYLPLSKLKDANEPALPELPARPADANAVATGTPDSDDMAIPPEIAERLRSRRPTRGPQRPEPAQTAPGTSPRKALTRVLVDAVGFVESRQGLPVFVPNALGRNVSAVHYQLLPCRVLEQTERRLAASPEPLRLKVAGLVTEYKGKKYLLLQRVIRVYNYGNFGG